MGLVLLGPDRDCTPCPGIFLARSARSLAWSRTVWQDQDMPNNITPKFVDNLPEASRRGRRPQTDWDAVADQLRTRPAQWAEIARLDYNIPANRSGSFYRPPLKRRSIEVTQRRDGDEIVIYARAPHEADQ